MRAPPPERILGSAGDNCRPGKPPPRRRDRDQVRLPDPQSAIRFPRAVDCVPNGSLHPPHIDQFRRNLDSAAESRKLRLANLWIRTGTSGGQPVEKSRCELPNTRAKIVSTCFM